MTRLREWGEFFSQVLSGLNQFKLEPEALKSEVGLLKSEVEALKAELESMAGTNKNAQLLRELRDTVKGQQRQVEEAKAEAERHKEEAMAANRRIKELEEAVARDEAMVREAEQRIEDGVAEAKKREIKLGQEKVQAEEEAKTEKLKVQKLTEELSNTFEHWHKTEDELSVKLKDRDAVLEDLGNQIETLIKEKEKVEAAKGEFEKILGAAVAITISEDAKMGAGGKQERRKLQHEMALDICATLGVSARRIQVVGASKVEGGTHAGALKIDMQILPKSTSPLEPTAIELVERILNEVANQESRLREEVKFGEHMLLAEPTFPHALIQGLREQALMMDAQLSGGPPPPLLSRAAASSSSGSPYANTSLLKTSTSSAAAAASSRPHPDSPRDTLSVTGLGALRGVQSKTSGNNRNSPGSSRGGGTNPSTSPPSRNSAGGGASGEKSNGSRGGGGAEGWQGGLHFLESIQQNFKL